MTNSSVFKKTTALLLALIMSISFLGIGNKVQADSTGVRGFVERLYYFVLGRDGDEDGINNWVNALNGGMSAADATAGFFSSPEFQSMNLTNSEYIDILYRTLMGREADPAGKADWLGWMDTGMTRRVVLSYFVNSQEFSNICASYGINRGSVSITDVLDVHYVKAAFVRRAYRLILSREPEEQGLRDWTSALANGTFSAAQMVNGFLNSPEFINKNTSSEEFVDILYRVFLNREGDLDGKNFWISLLDDAMVSRTFLVHGFAESGEFTGLASQYGIVRGNVPVTEARDRNYEGNKFIIGVYERMFGRRPSVDELNSWAGGFSSGMTGQTFMRTVFSTPAFTSKDNTNKVITMYQVALERTPSQGEIDSIVSIINSQGIDVAISVIVDSAEFSNKCILAGVPSSSGNGLLNIDGRYVHVVNGQRASGWQTVNGNKYYFDPGDNCFAATGWRYIGGYKYLFGDDGALCQNLEGVIGRPSTYALNVNTTNNTVTVFAYNPETGRCDIPYRAFACSCGLPESPTKTGDFTLQRLEPWRVLDGGVWGQYCTRISGNYLFHSSWFYTQGDRYSLSVRQYNRLGNNASHGCVRLCVADAKWIFDNCNGCRVHVATDAFTPFNRPATRQAVVVSGDRGYDPTDPGL